MQNSLAPSSRCTQTNGLDHCSYSFQNWASNPPRQRCTSQRSEFWRRGAGQLRSQSYRALRCSDASQEVRELRTGDGRITTPESVASAHGSREQLQDEGTIMKLWYSVSKKHMMTVGKAGVQPSHCNHLRELLSIHRLVKVKCTGDVETMVQSLCRGSGATIIHIRNKTVLFGEDGIDPSELLPEALERMSKNAEKQSLKRKEKKLEKEGIQLLPRVKTMLRSLEDRKVISSADIDHKAKRLLASLPESDQLQVLQDVSKDSMRHVRNRSAWLTTRIRLLLQTRGILDQMGEDT